MSTESTEPTPPPLPEWKQRVVDERDELAGRLQRLETFFDTETFAGVSRAERDRLRYQHSLMLCLQSVLTSRIDNDFR